MKIKQGLLKRSLANKIWRVFLNTKKLVLTFALLISSSLYACASNNVIPIPSLTSYNYVTVKISTADKSLLEKINFLNKEDKRAVTLLVENLYKQKFEELKKKFKLEK